MSVSRLGHVAAPLADGRVLVAGGYRTATEVLATAELYDPATGNFSATGSMTTGRAGAAATVLQNGKVLIAGGWRIEGTAAVPLSSAELYDPETGSFTATGSMIAARYGHTAVEIPGGSVLVAGGTGNRQALASAELYDPAAGEFADGGTMTTPRTGHAAILLTGGRVLLVGGATASQPGNPTYLASAETYDPLSGGFAATGSLTEARYVPTAVRLGDGRVLIAGGSQLGEGDAKYSLSSAELFDAGGTDSMAAGSMGSARIGQAAAALANGRVLMAGGMLMNAPPNPAVYLDSSELFDPIAGTFSSAGTMTAARYGATATVLADGRVLLVGGGSTGGTLASAEIYRP